MPQDSRRSPRAFAPFVFALALAAAGAYARPWLRAQGAPGAVAPGGFLETATSTTTRALPTAADLAALLPQRGTFTFPAPYNTTGIRLTNATDCGGNDCVNYVGYSYWRNMNNSAGSNYLYAFIGLSRANGGPGPSLFRYDKTTGETLNLGPLFAPDNYLGWGSGEGWYFSATQPTTLYMNTATSLVRYDVLTHSSSTVFDITGQFGSDKNVWQLHSSDDDRVHSFTLQQTANYAALGCAVYREDTHTFSFFPRVETASDYDECQVDKSGQWLLIKEDVDNGINGEDNRIIDLATGAETILLDANGAGGHSDNGYGVMIASDNANNLPNALRLWTFSPPPLASGPVIYRDPNWIPESMAHISFENARSAPLAQQYACGSAVSRINGPRANEVACVRLDTSMTTLVVAPVMTSLDTSGGGSDDYSRMPKGNLDPTGQYFIWTSNMMGTRMDAFIVRVPGQLLVTTSPTDDTTAPVVAIAAPVEKATVSGTVTLSAGASDNVGVVGVQFRLDAAPLGTEVTTAPYAWNWNTTTVPDGVHVLRAVARDAAGNTTLSVPVTVTVLNTPAGPQITGVAPLAVTGVTAVLSWATNQLADGQVDYGLTSAYGTTTPLAATLVKAHLQAIGGLTASTLYHYRITSKNAQGVAATTGDLTFPTAPLAAISGVAVSNITDTSVHIGWTTDLPSSSQVDFGPTTSYGAGSGYSGISVTAHGIDLAGLSAGATYHFRVSSITDAGVTTVSGDFTFSTLSGMVSGAAPGGFVESANSTAVRPLITAAQLQTMLPARGPFAFPAPYNTTGVRLTNATDCAMWYDCVNSLAGGAWRNLNNSAGSNFLYAVVGLDRTNGGLGPSVFRFDKTTGETLNLGPLFPADDDRTWGSLDGWYFSATMPTAFYIGLDTQLQRYDILTHTTSVVFDITAQFGDDKEVYHANSSNDDLVHSFTLRRVSDYVPIGCGVYREDTQRFSYFPAEGDFHECQIDKSGQWLLIKEDRDRVGNEDDRIIDLFTGTQTVLLQAQGAAGESDNGFGAMVAADGSAILPNSMRRWTFGPVAPGPLVSSNPSGVPPSLTHISFANARSAPFDQQYACGAAVNRTNGPRANEVVCARLDGSLNTLVVAPVMTDLDALGGGPDDDVIKQPYGNLNPTGQFFLWTTNLLSDRMEAILVRVPSQLLVTPPADTTAPTVTITTPANTATVSGTTNLTATASDNVAVVSLQFKVDGLDVGPGIVTAPYTWAWDTTTTPDGAHVVTAIARDAVGNTRTSTPVLVTVMNTPAGPQISGVGVSDVTEKLALVHWTTDQLADSKVEYGPTTAYGSTTPTNTARVTSHLLALAGIASGTTFHYRVTSSNAQGLATTSGDFTFMTTAAPIITAVSAPLVTPTTATVTWTTDIPSNTMIEYGVTTNYGDATNPDDALVTSHLQGLYDLTPGVVYHYRVYSVSAVGVMSVSGDFTFPTPGLVIGNVAASAIADTSALVSWNTDQASNSQVDYGPTAAYGSSTAIDGTLTTAHSQALGGLAAGTTYHYRVRSTTSLGLSATSGDFTFTTTGGLPPAISGVTASGMTGTSATIGWLTNQAADSQVEYGTTSAYGSLTSLAAALVTTHSQPLNGLTAGTLYHYRVKSRNGTGQIATSPDFTFTTLAPPAVSGVNASAITGTTATIGWTTDQNADAVVEYGLTTAYGGTAANGALVTAHSQALSGLLVGTLCHYRVTSTNAAGLSTTSGDFTFTTVAAPVVSGVAASAITGTTATIGWTTDQNADSQVEYGLTTTYGAATSFDATLATAHSQGLTGLAAGTLVHYRVRSRNGVGVLTISGDFTFTTTAAPIVSGVAASSITGTSATIGWATDQNADSQVEYGLTTAYGATTALNAALVTTHSQSLSGLAIGTTYHARVRSTNSVGLLSTSADLTFTTVAPPVISGAGVSALTGTSATIAWTTDQAADSQVEYGLTKAYGSSTTLNASLVTSHSQGVTGLAAGTTYHYRIRSANSAGLLTTTADATLTTIAPPAISAVIASAISGTSFTVGWTTNQLADSQIEYGTTTAYGSTTTLNASLVTAHSQAVTGLTPGTTYHFRVRSTNSTGLLTIAGDFTASTTPAFVQSAANTSDTAATTMTQAFTSATTAGDLIVAAISWEGAATYTCSDTQANVYTMMALQHDASGNQNLALCYAPSIKGGAVTVTATFSTSSAYRRLLVHEYSGIATSTPVDVSVQNTAAGTTTANGTTTAAATTTVAGDLIFAVVVDDAGVTTITAGTNYTARSVVSDSASEDRVQPAAGSVTATWTFAAAQRYLAQLTAFRARSTSAPVAPVVSAVATSAVTGTTATIGWTTDQPADSQVDVGLTTTYGTTTTVDPALVTAHGVGLTGLAAGTTYHYRVRSTNSAGLASVSGDFTFVTVAAPVVSGVTASAITGAAATIGWTTDQAADSQADYGPTTAYGSTTSLTPALVTTHSAGLSGLAAGTTYHYRVRSTNGVGLVTTSADATFTTVAPPEISGVGASAITNSTATIGWTTDQAADSQVDYGLTSAYGSTTTLNATLVTAHSQGLTSLAAGTTYHYRVRSTNGVGLVTTSADFVVTTAVPPPSIFGTGASAISGTTATIGWTTDQPADSQIDYGLSTSYGSTTSLNAALVTTHSQGLAGLAAGTTYHYRVRSKNSIGLLTTSTDFTLTTVAAPVVFGVSASAVTGTTAGIGWSTDQPSDSQVDYGLTTSYGLTTALDPTLVTTHGQSLSGLATGTLYHYRVRSTNSVGLLTTSADGTFTTVAAPVVSGIAASSITGTAVTIGWTTDQASDSQVEYGLTTAYGSTTTIDATQVATHSQTISGLAVGTLDHYRVKSANAFGLLTASADFTFTTVAPPAVSGVTASTITGTTATIGWTTDQTADSQVEYGVTTAYGATTALDASLVTNHSQGLAGLATGTLYHYRVRSTNSVGLLATSADATFTTVAPPVVSAVGASGITGTAVTVNWTTDQAADSQVEYGLTTAYGSATTLNASLVTSHSQNFAGLATGTLYHYRVKSTSVVGLLTTSGDFTFTTVAPPVISGLAASAITTSSATVGWTTDQAADSQVDYGTTTAYGNSTTFDATLVTAHSQPISGLATGTLYHYRVRSTNGVGLLTTSADATFTTIAPPVISSVSANSITGTAATIHWTTNQSADSQVDYGLTTAYGSSTTLNTSFVTTHNQGLTGLATGTLYHYHVKSANSAGLLTTSGDFTFTTATPPAISAVGASAITGTTATVSWTTDQTANSQVEYGLTTGYGSSTTLVSSLVTSHSQNLAGLATGTLYHYRVKSANSAGLLTTSGDFTFTTVAPPVISAIGASAITGTAATISWTTDQASDTLVEYGLTTSYGNATTLDASLVTSHGQGLTGLAMGTLYHYRVKSTNSVGLLTTSADGTFTTVAPPAVSAVGASAITGTTATIGWTTDQLADSQVEYGLTNSYGSTTTLDPTAVTTHSQNLSGLATGTLYHYRVRSTNSVGLLTTSADGTFTTVAPPVISSIAASAMTSVSLTLGWTTDQLADTQVEYGLTTAYGSTTTLNATLVTTHSQGLTGLAAGNTYHYRVRSTNSFGLLSVSADQAVTTTPPAIKQSASNTSDTASTTMTQAFTSTTTAGNLIVAAVSWEGTGTYTCSDTQGNVYTMMPLQHDTTGNQSLAICYAPNIKGGAVTVTATFSTSSAYRRLLIHEYSGLATGAPVDVSAQNIATGTTVANAITSGAATTTAASDLIFAVVVDDGGVTAITAGTNYAARATISDSASEDRVLVAPGSVTATWTFANAHRYLAVIVAFKGAGR